MKKILFSFAKSFSKAMLENEYIISLSKKYPKTLTYIKRRLSLTEIYGFGFSFGILLSILFLLYFIGTIQNILLTHDPLATLDVQIMNLIAALRNLKTANVLLFFTYLGNWQIIVNAGVAIIIILWLLGKKRMAKFFFFAVVSGELIYKALQEIIHRARPDTGFSLIPQGNHAFPSGHATMSIIFYGMLGFFLLRISKRWWKKILITIITITLIFLIGFSRVYLGVHWLSDIWGGWMIGFSILAVYVAYFRELEKFKPTTEKARMRPLSISAVGFCLLILMGFFICSFYKNNPLQIPEVKTFPTVSLGTTFDDLQKEVNSEVFPKFSETLVGKQMEPISFIVIAPEEKLVSTFEKVGWFVADEPNSDTLMHTLSASILNKSYPTAPATPSFLNGQVNNIAFEKPTDTNTVRERHHIRFWLTNFQYGNTPIWVATASFDKGMRYFVTHNIKPDIDTERDFIKDELLDTNNIDNIQEIQLVPRLLGMNQSGDQFFTDGQAYIVLLK
jgi:membrane-associated phospholipid phosphatase